ncbi:hypothetical protein D7V86_21465, partial [bacterium D16-51]
SKIPQYLVVKIQTSTYLVRIREPIMCEIGKLLIKQRAVFTGIASENGRTFLGICQVISRKK